MSKKEKTESIEVNMSDFYRGMAHTVLSTEIETYTEILKYMDSLNTSLKNPMKKTITYLTSQIETRKQTIMKIEDKKDDSKSKKQRSK